MKKIGLFVVLCSLAMMASAWGLERGFVSQLSFNVNGVKHQANYTSSALYVLLRSGKANFTACVDEYAFESMPDSATQADTFNLVEQTLTPWIAEVRKQIGTSGRGAEFADILTWLPSQMTLTPASCEKADIRIKVTSQRSAGKPAWAYNPTLRAWQLVLPSGRATLSDAWKESGSFWGLGILTATFQPQTVGEGRFKNTTDEKYSLYAVADSHPAPGASVMWWKQPASVSLTCDDVEGFINAVDFVQFMEGETSPRLENGWKSLCGHPYYYLRGRVVADPEELDALRQETSQYRQTGQTLAVLQQLLNQWNDYRQTQVIPVLSDSRKALAAQPRPLDDKGLMLSAQVNHLERVEECASQAIKRIKEYGEKPQRCVGSDCPALQVELAELNCSVELDPLKTPGLMEATPLQQDYPAGQMHTCGVCGQSIEIGKEVRDAVYEHHKKRTVRYPYFRHATCAAASPEQARAYRDNVTQVQAPTYAQLQTRMWLAQELAARKRTAVKTNEITLPFQDNVPAVLKRSVASSTAKGTTSVVSRVKATSATGTNTPAQHTRFHALDTVKSGEKVRCSVCGEEISEGEVYYKRTESQFMHRGGQCAYSFFAKKHDVDEDALASYTRSYSFETPQEVTSARADMKALGLSADTVRQLRTQEETAAQQQAQQRVQEQKRQEARTRLNTQCRVYMKVTAQDVARFKTLYGKQLARIEQKVAKHHKLTQQQKRLQKQYKQLLQDEKTTQECLAFEQAAHY